MQRLKPECKALLLGTALSSKTTVLKQFKIIFRNGYTKEELDPWRAVIHGNVLASACLLIKAMNDFGIKPEREKTVSSGRYLLSFNIKSTYNGDTPLGPEAGEAIASLWHDPCMSKLLEHKFPLGDWAV